MNRINMTPFQRQVIEETLKNTSLKFKFGLMSMVEIFGAEIAITRGAEGAYVYSKHVIALCHSTRRTDALNTKTLFHELIHSTALHLGRPIDRCGALRGNPVDRAIEEVIAESGARILMNFFGLNNADVDAKMQSYIDDYLTDFEPQHRDHCLREANRAAQLILDHYIPLTAQQRIEGAA